MRTATGNNGGTKDVLRDDAGQYAVAFERLCTCGHPKSHHLAGKSGRSLGGCITHECPGGADETCACEKFRAAR